MARPHSGKCVSLVGASRGKKDGLAVRPDPSWKCRNAALSETVLLSYKVNSASLRGDPPSLIAVLIPHRKQGGAPCTRRPCAISLFLELPIAARNSGPLRSILQFVMAGHFVDPFMPVSSAVASSEDSTGRQPDCIEVFSRLRRRPQCG